MLFCLLSSELLQTNTYMYVVRGMPAKCRQHYIVPLLKFVNVRRERARVLLIFLQRHTETNLSPRLPLLLYSAARRCGTIGSRFPSQPQLSGRFPTRTHHPTTTTFVATSFTNDFGFPSSAAHIFISMRFSRHLDTSLITSTRVSLSSSFLQSVELIQVIM